MPRTILIHLNVEVPDDDPRTGDEIADKVLAACEVGLEGAPGDLASGSDGVHYENMVVALAMAEEV